MCIACSPFAASLGSNLLGARAGRRVTLGGLDRLAVGTAGAALAPGLFRYAGAKPDSIRVAMETIKEGASVSRAA